MCYIVWGGRGEIVKSVQTAETHEQKSANTAALFVHIILAVGTGIFNFYYYYFFSPSAGRSADLRLLSGMYHRLITTILFSAWLVPRYSWDENLTLYSVKV